MNNNLSNVEISVQELKLLVNTLTKSVALSLRKRYTWLGVVAGLLIGSCLTLAIISLTAKNTDKITETTQTLLENSRETLSELKQINSKISRFAPATHGVNEKNRHITRCRYQRRLRRLWKKNKCATGRSSTRNLHSICALYQ